jgi:hypothetical protein
LFHRILLVCEDQGDGDGGGEVGSALIKNALSPSVLFMRPAFFQAMRASSKPRLAYVAAVKYVQFCLGSRMVPTVENICIAVAQITAASPRAYFRVWDGALGAVLVPLLDLAARLWRDMLIEIGVADLWKVYGVPEEVWKEHFSLDEVGRLDGEVQALPECANDGKWGFVRARLEV